MVEAQTAAFDLAKRMPSLIVEAKRVAQTVAYGIHGRRRAGPGETFWQFRHYQSSDNAPMIDWRRSASSSHLYVREREWEAAHTFWLWVDLSPSMLFGSHLATSLKVERALVLALATAELLVSAGERVGVPGLMAPTAQRTAMQKMAIALANAGLAGGEQDSMPPRLPFRRFSALILFSDFLEPLDMLRPVIEHYTGQGMRGHLLQILDPAEETLPYTGRIEFSAMEGGAKVLTERAEAVRQHFRMRMVAHRDNLRQMIQRLEWSFGLHHTDRPAGDALLALYSGLAGFPAPRSGERGDDGRSAGSTVRLRGGP